MKKWLIVVVVIISAALIIWLGLSAKFVNCFWCITFPEWIKLVVTIVIGIFVAYFLVERNNKKRKFNELIINKIEKLISKLDNDCKQVITSNAMDNWNVKLLATTKEVSNSIELLKRYQKELNAETEMQFIIEQFAEYRTIVTECIEKLKDDSQLRDKAILKINLITEKLSTIEVKQYEL